MKAYMALIKRELIEHRGAFLYAPAVLLAVLFVLIILGLVFGDTQITHTPDSSITGAQIYQLALAAVMGMWSAYLMVALFFYYADSFSADRRNNSLLFWKSMPQSDLKILTSKALAGITIFPTLVFCFAMLTGLLVYLLGFLLVAKLPFIPLAGPVEMISSWVQMGISGALFFVLTVLWYAPFLGWVAGLSTIVQRWSIPLAFLVPGVVVLVEFISSYGETNASRPIASYLAYRSEGILEDVDIFQRFVQGSSSIPLDLMGKMFADTDWLHMALGLGFAALVVFLASEYRRRRIEA